MERLDKLEAARAPVSDREEEVRRALDGLNLALDGLRGDLDGLRKSLAGD